MTKPEKRSRTYTPVRVPFAATQAGETPDVSSKADIRQWAHWTVWTDRMLETLLENKVKGGRWHTLIDKVFSKDNLYSSAQRAGQ